MRLAALLLAALPLISACGTIVGATSKPGASDDGSNDPSSDDPAQRNAPAASPTSSATTSTTPPPAPTPSKLAFVTSTTVAGTDAALDTRTSADALCNALAAAAGLTGKTFAAWLSEGSTSPAGVIKTGVRYVRPDGATIAADLLAAMKAKTTLDNAIALDERLGMHTGSVWTFTNYDGNAGQTCAGSSDPSSAALDIQIGSDHGGGATGTLGTITTDAHAWTESGTTDHCDEKKPIYCFEQ